MRVAVRPSPPYRTWVKDNVGPVTWEVAVNHSGRVLSKAMSSRKPKVVEPSSGSRDLPPGRIFRDQTCQTPMIHSSDGFCQTESRVFADCGIGPDLIRLETRMAPYCPVQVYHPPWPVVWVQVMDALGVIRDTVWTMPTPVEEEVLMNQFPPETTHETVAAYVFPADALTMRPARRPFVPPLPPPPFMRPPPPAEAPGYVPIPLELEPCTPCRPRY